MKPSPSWITQAGAWLLAVICGAVLIPVLAVLAVGCAVRAVGTLVANLARVLQALVFRLLTWADAKLSTAAESDTTPGTN